MKIYGRIKIVPQVSSHMLLRLKPSFREGNKMNYIVYSHLTFSGNQNRKSNYIFSYRIQPNVTFLHSRFSSQKVF